MVVQQTLSYLNQGKIILYPTDTVWGVGGDATRADVVQRIYELKKRYQELTKGIAGLKKKNKTTTKSQSPSLNALPNSSGKPLNELA